MINLLGTSVQLAKDIGYLRKGFELTFIDLAVPGEEQPDDVCSWCLQIVRSLDSRGLPDHTVEYVQPSPSVSSGLLDRLNTLLRGSIEPNEILQAQARQNTVEDGNELLT